MSHSAQRPRDVYNGQKPMDSETMDSEAIKIDAMDIAHARHLIPAYVLGLLSADDCRRVEHHAQQCPACREAIRRERQIEALVRQSVQVAARPAAGRLVQLRPTAPSRVARARGRLYHQLAPLTALAVLLVVILLAQTDGPSLFLPVFAGGDTLHSTTSTATATMTHTPTATLAATYGAASDPAATAAATLTRAARSDAPAAPRPAEAIPPNGPPAQATPIVVTVR